MRWASYVWFEQQSNFQKVQMTILTVCQRVRSQVRFAKCTVWNNSSSGFTHRKKESMRIGEGLGLPVKVCSFLHSTLAKQSYHGRQKEKVKWSGRKEGEAFPVWQIAVLLRLTDISQRIYWLVNFHSVSFTSHGLTCSVIWFPGCQVYKLAFGCMGIMWRSWGF